ncbi:MAG: O-antigen ligase family protein [Erysipelotrichaceae bacterium]|nr:O-antigen ligase family protein [Erysipelotrichaceae bacterium]
MKFINKNMVKIQKSLRILVFFLGFNSVIPIVNGSILFWAVIIFSIVYGFKMFFDGPKDFIFKNKYKIIFIIICTISSLVNYSYMNIYSYVKTLIMCLMFFILTTHTKEQTKETLKNEMDIIFHAIIMFSFFITGGSLIKAIITEPNNLIDSFFGVRYLGGYYENSNQSASWAFFSLILGLIYFNNNKIFFTINSIIQLIMIVISGSRSVYIGLFISVIVYFLYYSIVIKRKSKKKITIIIFLLSILALIFLIVTTLLRFKWIFKYMDYINFENLLDVLSSYRYFMWKEAFIIFINKPLLGVGVSNIYEATHNFFGSESIFTKLNMEDPHNIFISLLAYTGILGFISFSMIIFTKTKKIISVIKNEPNNKTISLLILFISIFIFSIFDVAVIFDTHIATMLFWYIAGIFTYKSNSLKSLK